MGQGRGTPVPGVADRAARPAPLSDLGVETPHPVTGAAAPTDPPAGVHPGGYPIRPPGVAPDTVLSDPGGRDSWGGSGEVSVWIILSYREDTVMEVSYYVVNVD